MLVLECGYIRSIYDPKNKKEQKTFYRLDINEFTMNCFAGQAICYIEKYDDFRELNRLLCSLRVAFSWALLA